MATPAVFSEHDSEPVHGLPAVLPPGEKLLWQGSPQWRSLALNAYRVRALTIYFTVIVAARGVYLIAGGATVFTVRWSRALNSSMNAWISNGRSSLRSRRGGSVIEKTLRR